MLSATSVLASADGAEHWWVVAPFFWVLWLALIVTVFFLVFRRRRWHSGDTAAKAILAERFARGEISGEEFRERLQQLP